MVRTDTPAHVEKTCKQWQTIDPTANVLQLPTIIRLLETVNFGDTDTLRTELTEGFRMMGDLAPGTGWKPRYDQHYNNPVSETEFVKHNDRYIQE